jgi:hypothetical protein
MSQPGNFDPPNPIDRPLCSNCGWTMWIAAIEPHDDGCDRHTLKCHRCEHQEIKIVKI